MASAPRWDQLLLDPEDESPSEMPRAYRHTSVDAAVPALPSQRSFASEEERKSLMEEDGRVDNQLLGLLLMTIASVIFGTTAMFVSLSPISGLFLMEIRCLVQWLLSISCIVLWRLRNPNAKRTVWTMMWGEPNARGWILLRSGFHWLFMVSYWLAARLLPFGSCTALVYVGPLLTAIPAWLFLGERIGPEFFVVAPISFAGLLLVSQPQFVFGREDDPLSPLGLAFALCSTISLTVLPVITRSGKDSHWMQIEHGATFYGAFVLTPLAILLEHRLDPTKAPLAVDVRRAFDLLAADYASLALVLLIPCAHFLALAFQTVAYQVAEASKCCLMLYLQIPQSYVVQYLILHVPMTPLGNLGIGCIMSACLLNAATVVYRLSHVTLPPLPPPLLPPAPNVPPDP